MNIADQARPMPLEFAWTWVGKTWLLFSRDRVGMFCAALIYWVCIAIASQIPFIGQELSGLITPLLTLGILKICNDLDRGKPMRVGDVFVCFNDEARFKKYRPLALISGGTALVNHMIGWVSTHIGLPIPLSLMLMSLPILLNAAVLSILLMYSLPLMEFRRSGLRSALETSIVLTLKNWKPLLLMGFVQIGLFLVALLSLGLAYLVLVPMMTTITYVIYRESFPVEE